MRQSYDNRTILDCVGFDLLGKGELAVRFQLASFRGGGSVVDDGSRTGPIQKQKHRFVLQPGDDIDTAIAVITPHLESMGYSPPSEADVAKLKAIATICWTPEAVEQYNAMWREWVEHNNQHCADQGIPALTLEGARLVDFLQRMEAIRLPEKETVQ